MKKHIILSLLLSCTITIMAQTIALDVETNGFSANWFESENKSMSTLIIFGGSEGGKRFGDSWAPKLNELGYNVLSIAYFGEEGLPEQLELIPLEDLDYAIDWLDQWHGETNLKYGLIGVSKGAELTLVQASRINRFDAVVAIAPSSVVWQSINRTDFMNRKSSWVENGEPLDFLPYCYAKGFESIFNFYDCALDSLDKRAVIKVENIKAPLLLISGRDDKLWPSERMSDMITERLASSNHKYVYKHRNFPTAGHWLIAPHLHGQSQGLTEKEMGGFAFLGGSPDELGEISGQVEALIYDFLKEAMKK